MRRNFQYGNSQKTDLVFHTFISGLSCCCLFRFFPGLGQSFQFFSNSSTSSLLLRSGIPRVSDLPSNRSPRFLHGSFLPRHLHWLASEGCVSSSSFSGSSSSSPGFFLSACHRMSFASLGSAK